MIRYALSLILLFVNLSLSAQVIIQFVPEVSGRNVDGLFQCKILNQGRAQNAVLSITVTERSKGTVCIIKTPSFALTQGTNSIPFSAARNAAIQFSGSGTGQLTRVNRQFPQGDYDYCFSIKLSQSDLADEQCFSYLLAPFADLSLIEPADQDKVCNTRPLFSWQPLIPGIPGSYYQLVLVEVKTGQNITEALNYNFPVINQSGITAPVLPYPSVARELQKAKRYAWQVTAYKDQTILNRSEIWSFTLDCQDEVKAVTNIGYRDITDLLKGNNYIAFGELRFALVNPYDVQELNYTIKSLHDPERPIRHLPKLILRSGDNQIAIDLKSNSNFKQGEYYILELSLRNRPLQQLRFLYEEPQ